MNILGIEIKNFKGIQYIDFELPKKTRSRFYTFIGLNESGKTTILEAISNFCYGKDPIITSESEQLGQIDYQDMIPISERGNFNEAISILFKVSLSETDIRHLEEEFKKQYPNISQLRTNNPLSVVNEISFKDSQHTPSPRLWDLNLEIKEKKRGARFKKIKKASNEMWQDAARILQKLFPDIIYFPSSLFDFPGRIYLDAQDSIKDEFYSKVIQDVLNAIEKGYDIKKHVLDRMMDDKETLNRNLKAVLADLSKELTSSIVSNWQGIFPTHQRNAAKIVVSNGVDLKHDDGHYYLDFSIEDENGLSAINERSLGFRWFFVFRLLTHYRGFRYSNGEKNILFLLDEPASNLHPSAQQKLLSCFESLPSNCYVFYTTHSHHMVNPSWLETTYIVKNEGIDYDNVQKNGQTNISLTKYSDFVRKFPDATTYFQPVLDILDYKLSNIESINNPLIVEGKNDFYALALMKNILGLTLPFDIIPAGNGCDCFGPLISLYTGWGKNFHILFDSDPNIEKKINTYEGKYGIIVCSRMHTIGSLLESPKHLRMESLFSEQDTLNFIDDVDKMGNSIKSKNRLFREIQTMLLGEKEFEFSDETKRNFKDLFSALIKLY